MTLKKQLSFARRITNLLDNKFKIGPFRFGLDPIIGLIPGLGDALPLIISSYLIYLAIQHNVPKATLFKMMFYSMADFVIGSIPIIGDIYDFFFRAYHKNYQLLEKQVQSK